MIDSAYIARLAERLAEVEKEISLPGAAANQRTYRELIREHLRLRKIMEKATVWSNLKRDIAAHGALIQEEQTEPELRQLAQEELREMEQSLPGIEHELVLALLPPDPDEARNVVMEIRAGTGGDEAALFAGELFRMYSRLIENKGWRLSVVDASPSDLGGYKEIVFTVEGENVYGTMRYESGCHRVQRVPVTESAGRIHTSAATVAVLPEADEVDEIQIPAEEIRVDIFCASGPGGQGVNTTYSAVRITHLPTGLVAQSQDERSQHRNRDKAMNVLKARLLDYRRQQEEEKAGHARRSQIGSGDRSEKIRTYNFPQNRLTDHRISFTIYSLNRFMEGEMDTLLTALRERDMAVRIQLEMTPR